MMMGYVVVLKDNMKIIVDYVNLAMLHVPLVLEESIINA